MVSCLEKWKWSCSVMSNSFNPVDYSLPGTSIRGILQARILEWVAISFSRGSSQPRDRTRVSCNAGRHFTLWATKEAHPVLCNAKNVPSWVQARSQQQGSHLNPYFSPVSRTKSWEMTDFHSNQNFTNVAKEYLGYHRMDSSLNNWAGF